MLLVNDLVPFISNSRRIIIYRNTKDIKNLLFCGNVDMFHYHYSELIGNCFIIKVDFQLPDLLVIIVGD